MTTEPVVRPKVSKLQWIQFGNWAGSPAMLIQNFNKAYVEAEHAEGRKVFVDVPGHVVPVTTTPQIKQFPGERPYGSHVAFVSILESAPKIEFRVANEIYRVIPNNYQLDRIHKWDTMIRPQYNEVPNHEKYFYRFTAETDQRWFFELIDYVTSNRFLLLAFDAEVNLNRFSILWELSNLFVSIIQPHNFIGNFEGF